LFPRRGEVCVVKKKFLYRSIRKNRSGDSEN